MRSQLGTGNRTSCQHRQRLIWNELFQSKPQRPDRGHGMLGNDGAANPCVIRSHWNIRRCHDSHPIPLKEPRPRGDGLPQKVDSGLLGLGPLGVCGGSKMACWKPIVPFCLGLGVFGVALQPRQLIRLRSRRVFVEEPPDDGDDILGSPRGCWPELLPPKRGCFMKGPNYNLNHSTGICTRAS